MNSSNKHVVLYLKFFSQKKYMKAFLKGEWYSNSVEYFRNLEGITHIRGQGDSNELKYTIGYGKLVIPQINNQNIEIMFKNAKVEHKLDGSLPLVCFVGIDPNDLIPITVDNERRAYKLPFTEEEYKLMREKFGNYVVIINPDALNKRLFELSKKYNILFDKIEYKKQSNVLRADAVICGKQNRFFFKDDDLAYQREYRLCIFTKMPNNHIFIVEPFSKTEAVGLSSEYLKNSMMLPMNN